MDCWERRGVSWEHGCPSRVWEHKERTPHSRREAAPDCWLVTHTTYSLQAGRKAVHLF